MWGSSLFWSSTSTLNDLWRKNSVIISKMSKTIQLGFKTEAGGSVWRDKPLRLKGLNFTLQIEQEHFKWAGTLGILLRFKCAGKTFRIKSTNNAVQSCAQHLLKMLMSSGLGNINSQPSFTNACSFSQINISTEKGNILKTEWIYLQYHKNDVCVFRHNLTELKRK